MASLTSCSCPTTPAEEIHLGRDNVIAYVLREQGVAIADLSPISRVVVTIEETIIDSDAVPPATIRWDLQTEYKGETVDYLQLQLGHQDLTPGVYTMDVTAYDPSNQAGVLWGNDIPVSVVED